MGLEPTSGSEAATGFQDRPLIQPDDFHNQFRGLESNQRPPGSEPGVATSSDCPGSLHFETRHSAEKFGEKDSNLHTLVQSQLAYR